MENTTDHDYADIINPYVRAEHEARMEGFRHGVGVGIFGTIMVLSFAFAMIFYRIEARAAERTEWWVQETKAPIKASDAGCRITVSHNNAVSRSWLTFCVR